MIKKDQSKLANSRRLSSIPLDRVGIVSNSDSSNDSQAGVRNQASGKQGNVNSLIAAGDYEGAIKAIGKSPGDDVSLNLLGVCLLRGGRAKEAAELYRRLALIPGSTLVREQVNPVFVRNYAVALLMSGLPGAVTVLLSDVPERNHPMALQIEGAIRNWAKSLPFFRRWDWRISGIAPTDCHIPLDFAPGEFYFPSRTCADVQDSTAIPSSKLAV